ncbi:MAG TPA: fused MFS/spermidine synthase [Thermoanaerobaculia bacterium]|nr:fused MFS/spermidine synthase [Thermoanaerobaculia bacterium]
MTGAARPSRSLLHALVFASGALALVYEVLWLKQLGLLFGTTAEAAGVTLAAFFFGLGAGYRFWGRRAARVVSPVRVYGWLEIGVAATAVLYFLLLSVYHRLYEPLFALLGNRPAAFLATKALLGLVLLFPPTFLMGGTLPVLAQGLAGAREGLGVVAARLYFVNTAGAVFGVLLAGFVLPPLVGFRAAYLIAMAGNLAVGVAAVVLGRPGTAGVAGAASAGGEPESLSEDDDNRAQEVAGIERLEPRAATAAATTAATTAVTTAVGVRLLTVLAFSSGFLTLALEVLWTRMYVQVVQHSVYSFSIILATFLAALAAGSWVAHRLSARSADPRPALAGMLAAGGLGVGLTPVVLFRWTDGLELVAGDRGWIGYVLSVFGYAAVLLLPVGVLLGTVFPLLFRFRDVGRAAAGRVVGDLGSLNTLGGIAGSLGAAFVLLPRLGLWRSLELVACSYLGLALLIPVASSARAAKLAAVAVGAVLLLLARPASLAAVRVAPGEELLEVWEGSHGTVAVLSSDGDLRMRLNNSYLLGSAAASDIERRQAHLPLMIHPAPRSVFFLGMGTSITVGAALAHPVERVVVAELSPEVAAAARRHFAPFNQGLFDDARVEVLVEDGRNVLAGSPEHFDVIVGDLFTPWNRGVGNLYTREHFETVRERLAEGGLFAQWLPLYQLTSREVALITRTFTAVFPETTLWRGDFYAVDPIVALVGRREGAPPLALAPILASQRRLRALGEQDPQLVELGPMVFYAGNLSRAPGLIAPGPLNTDDRPLLEYLAPISQRQEKARRSRFLTSSALISLFDELAAQSPYERDPLLVELPPSSAALARAGLAMHQSVIAEAAGALDERDRLIARARELLASVRRAGAAGPER